MDYNISAKWKTGRGVCIDWSVAMCKAAEVNVAHSTLGAERDNF